MPKLSDIFTDKKDGALNGTFYGVLFLVLAHVFFWQLLVPGRMIFGTDIQNQSYPIQHMAVREMLSNRSLMLWNPYIFSGMPFLASFSFPFFYPAALLFFILPLGFAMGYEFVVHAFLMGVFMYALMRRLSLSRQASFVGGLVFMFNAHFISLIYPGHGGKLFTITFLPLALMLLDRALDERPWFNFPLMGVVVGLMFFAGHVQILFYCGIALLLFLVFRLASGLKDGGARWALRGAAGFCAAFALGTMLYAVMLIPAWEYRGYTHRAGGVTGASSWEFATSFSQPPEDMLYIPLRDPFGWGKDYGSDVPTTDGIFYRGRIGLRLSVDYAGVFAIVLALIGALFKRSRYTWYFVSLALLAAFLALGKFNPLYVYVYDYIPGFSIFRVPYAIMILLPLCFGALSAFGLQYLLDEKAAKGRRGLLYFIAAGTAAGVTALVAGMRWNANPRAAVSGFLEHGWVREMLWGMYFDAVERFRYFLGSWFVFVVLLLFCMLVLYLYRKGAVRVKYIAAVFAVLILADLWTVGWGFVKTVPVSAIGGAFLRETPQIKAIKADRDGPFRVFSLVTNNELLYHGIQDVRGYHAVTLEYYDETLSRINFGNRVLDMLNAKYLMLPDQQDYDFGEYPVAGVREELARKYELVSRGGGVLLYRNRDVLPRAYLVGAVWLAGDIGQVLGLVADQRFDPAAVAVLTKDEGSGLRITPGADLTGQKVEVAGYSADRIEFDVIAPADSFMVVSEVWYPGWKAYVDGERTKIYRTDYTLRGLSVPEGAHRVVMEFEPTTYYVGAAVSTLTLLFVAFLLGRTLYRDRKAAGGGEVTPPSTGGGGGEGGRTVRPRGGAGRPQAPGPKRKKRG